MSQRSQSDSMSQKNSSDTISDPLAVFCREVRNLLRSKPNCMIQFSKFVPAYHNHYGRQCCVYQFGYTKLIELLESIPHVVQIIGCDSTTSPSKDNQNCQLAGVHSNGNASNNSNSNSNSNSNASNSSSNFNQRYITLTHREQIKRFASDLIKVVKSQPGKRLKLSQFAQAYEQVLGRTFRVLDYGTNNINVLLVEIWEGTINIIPIKREHVDEELRNKPALFVDVPLQSQNSQKPASPVLAQLVASHELVNKPYITQQYPDCWFEIPKRERSEREIKRTKYFIWDVTELLSRMKPNYSVPFSKFIPAYHYYFNRQCKVSIFGFSKLIDLFESISPEVVEIIDQGPGEEKIIQLAKRHWPPAPPQSPQRSKLQQQQQQQQLHHHHHHHHHHRHHDGSNQQSAQQFGHRRNGSMSSATNALNHHHGYRQQTTHNASQHYAQRQQPRNQRYQPQQQQQQRLLIEAPKQSATASPALISSDGGLSSSSAASSPSSELSAATSSAASSSSSSGSSSCSCSHTSSSPCSAAIQGDAIDHGPTEEEMLELEDELEAYEQLEAIKNKRSTRMAAILDIFKYSIY